MPTLTTKFGFQKPLVNNSVDADLWGGQLNTNFDDLDDYLSLLTSSKSATFTVGTDEFNYTYLVDASGGSVTVNLPATANVFNGFCVRIKAIDLSNSVTIDGSGSETIDGSLTFSFEEEDMAVTIVSDGSNWQIINKSYSSAMASKTYVDNAVDAVETTIGTPVAMSGNTEEDFTVSTSSKKITISLREISLSGTSNLLIQIGDSGGVVTTGYTGTALGFGLNTGTEVSLSTGFRIFESSPTAADAYTLTANLYLINESSNIWQISLFGNRGLSGGGGFHITDGYVSLSNPIETVRLTAVNGTDTLDAGTLNVIYGV